MRQRKSGCAAQYRQQEEPGIEFSVSRSGPHFNVKGEFEASAGETSLGRGLGSACISVQPPHPESANPPNTRLVGSSASLVAP